MHTTAQTPAPKATSAPSNPADRPDVQPPLDPRIHELSVVIGNKNVISEEDVNTILGSYLGETEIVVQRWALVVAGDRLRRASMSTAVRGQLETMITLALADQNWRIRRCAIASIDGSPLSQRADMIERIQSLVDDPQPEVAASARLALGMKPAMEKDGSK